MALSQDELRECRDLIRGAGLRATSSRLAVLALLRSEDAALSHAEVAELLQAAAFDRATLYRNLVDLTEAGLLRRVELGDHTWRFEVVTEGHDGVNGHPHFVCSECGSVSCLPELEFRSVNRTSLPRSVEAKNVEVQLRGVCDECV